MRQSMQVYSQNEEQKVILNYFKDKAGTLLSIGENDGQTLSNTRALILNGWVGDLVEPAPIPLEKLKELYKDNHSINIIDSAICDYTGVMSFFVSGEHLGKGDTGLLSTLSLADKQKWEKSTEFKELTIPTLSWADFYNQRGFPKYDFISIDAEGYDFNILSQIDLIETQTAMVCIEWNSLEFEKFDAYFKKYNMSLLLMNGENLIYAI